MATNEAEITQEDVQAPAPVSVVENVQDPEQIEEAYPEPKGAWAFVLLMAAFYIFYWTLSYFEIFIFRGA